MLSNHFQLLHLPIFFLFHLDFHLLLGNPRLVPREILQLDVIVQQLLDLSFHFDAVRSVHDVLHFQMVVLPRNFVVCHPFFVAVFYHGYLPLVLGILDNVLGRVDKGPVTLNKLKYVIIDEVILEHGRQHFSRELMYVHVLF